MLAHAFFDAVFGVGVASYHFFVPNCQGATTQSLNKFVNVNYFLLASHKTSSVKSTTALGFNLCHVSLKLLIASFEAQLSNKKIHYCATSCKVQMRMFGMNDQIKMI